MEAMSCGLPVIISDARPGVLDLIIKDGETGLAVPVENSIALASAFELLANNPALCKRLECHASTRFRVRTF